MTYQRKPPACTPEARRLRATGMTVPEIAERLGVSQATAYRATVGVLPDAVIQAIRSERRAAGIRKVHHMIDLRANARALPRTPCGKFMSEE